MYCAGTPEPADTRAITQSFLSESVAGSGKPAIHVHRVELCVMGNPRAKLVLPRGWTAHTIVCSE